MIVLELCKSFSHFCGLNQFDVQVFGLLAYFDRIKCNREVGQNSILKWLAWPNSWSDPAQTLRKWSAHVYNTLGELGLIWRPHWGLGSVFLEKNTSKCKMLFWVVLKRKSTFLTKTMFSDPGMSFLDAVFCVESISGTLNVFSRVFHDFWALFSQKQARLAAGWWKHPLGHVGGLRKVKTQSSVEIFFLSKCFKHFEYLI